MKYLFKRSNPSIAGVSLGRYLFDGLGLGLVAAGNDLVVAPIVKPMISTLPHLAQKGIDAITTGAVAVIGGRLLGMVHRELGDGIREGGLTLAGGKVVSMAIPGFQIGVTTPHSLADAFSQNTALAASSTNPALSAASASANNSNQLPGSTNLQLGQGSSGAAVFNEFGGKLATNQNWAL